MPEQGGGAGAMTRIFEDKRKGPGTHALVIGVGAGLSSHDAGLIAPLESARNVSDWLRRGYRNPTAELSSIELLASQSGRPLTGGYARVSPGEKSDFQDIHLPLEWPSRERLRDAVLQWRKRCDSDPENIALLYFAGSGGPMGLDTGLALHGGPTLSANWLTISFFSILTAMQSCRTRRQVYFLDILKFGLMDATPQALVASTSPPRLPAKRAIFYAPASELAQYARPAGPTHFSKALIGALENARPGGNYQSISLTLLEKLIRDELRDSPTEGGFGHVRADITNDFEFHFPSIEGTSFARPPIARAPPPSAQSGTAAKSGLSESPGPKSELAALLREKEAWLEGKRIKIDFGAAGIVILDGVEGRIAEEDGPADTTISVDWDDWQAMSDGTLDGMTAFMQSKLRVTGDMANAMQLQGVLAKMRPPAAEPAPAARTRRGAAKKAGGDSAPPRKRVRRTPPLEVPPSRPSPPPGPQEESSTEFVPDDAETERDELGRSVLAIGLARRLHRIWRTANDALAPADLRDERAAFVLHLDAPWGGGKTTFANYLTRVLDPLSSGREPAAFLRERYGEADLGGIFLDDPPADPAAAERLAKLPPGARRPWIVVPFNAWQVEHCAPPWWVFYQTIRKGCFAAIRKDGDLPWQPGEGQPRLPWLQRMDLSAKLWVREIGWRLTNPKVRSLLVTAAISFLLLLLLQRFGIWGLTGGREAKTGFLLTSGFGLALGGVTTVTFLWGLGALFTESVVPGTDSLAERLSLGSGDPFERFRRHFALTIARIRRPVMVVVDDLDRCKPDFVVGIVRGMQTLLRSPRVVFVILGDRDWIERAFEAHHKPMEKVDVGPEQTFGARFVEKAIQMSFILPAMGDEGRLAYVRRVLLGAAPQPAREAGAGMDADTAKAVREVVNREAAAPDSDPFDTERIVTRALEEVGSRPDASEADETALQLQVEQLVGETLAINASSSERVEQAVAHQLEALAGHFPANPRQIKRIVNAITVYYAVALQRPGLNPDEAFRTQLALWIIIMTEWPETWRLLASFPALVPILQSEDPLASLKAEGADLPGSLEATATVVKRILADAELMALIKGRGSAPLDAERVPLLAQLTPVHSRKRRLPEEKAAKPEGETEPAP
jgi:putative sterol carrier protein